MTLKTIEELGNEIHERLQGPTANRWEDNQIQSQIKNLEILVVGKNASAFQKEAELLRQLNGLLQEKLDAKEKEGSSEGE